MYVSNMSAPRKGPMAGSAPSTDCAGNYHRCNLHAVENAPVQLVAKPLAFYPHVYLVRINYRKPGDEAHIIFRTTEGAGREYELPVSSVRLLGLVRPGDVVDIVVELNRPVARIKRANAPRPGRETP